MILGGMAMAIYTSIRFLIRSNNRRDNIYYAFLKEKSSNDIDRKFASYFIDTIFFIKVSSQFHLMIFLTYRPVKMNIFAIAKSKFYVNKGHKIKEWPYLELMELSFHKS